MKIYAAELTGLLSKSAPPTQHTQQKTRTISKRSGRAVGRVNEFKVLKALAQFGHLRIVELARCVWPHARYGEQVCRRVVARLLQQSLILKRRNALGSSSYCLSRGGASWLEARGVEAMHGADLHVTGSTFFHRTMASTYLLERQVNGFEVAGEYQLLRRKLPFAVEGLVKALRKLPDGLIWQRKMMGPMDVEIMEQEFSSKARGELEKCLKTVEFLGRPLDGAGLYRVGGLVFVFDRNLNHARRILLAANSLWGDRSQAERAELEKRVKLVSVELRDPLVWVSSSTTTLHDLRLRGV